MLHTLFKDTAYSARMIAKTPVVSAIAIISLALGVSANVSIFSLVNSWLLRPLPYPDAERLVMVYENNRNDPDPSQGVSPANYFDWQEQSGSFDAWIAASYDRANLTGIDEPQQLRVARVTPNFFDLLGAQAMQGRTFVADEGGADDERVAVMLETVWRTQYGSDPGAVGSKVILDGEPVTVVGIVPETFDFILGDVSLWIADDFLEQRDDRATRRLQVTGRLRSDVSVEQARVELDAIAGRLSELYPETNREWGINPVPIRQEFPDPTDRALVKVLMLVVFLALLIATANVASLLLAKADARQREMAIRSALGAGKVPLVRQLLIESVMMALLAGALGTLLSIWGVRFIAQALPAVIPDFYFPQIDGSVVAFAAVVSVFAGLTFGMPPALQALAADLRGSLVEGGRGGTGTIRRRRLRNAFVMAEFAMALTILIGAAVLTDWLDRRLDIDAGYDLTNVLTMELMLPDYKYPDAAARVRFVQEIGRRFEEVPGVASWAVVNELPRTFGLPVSTFVLDGEQDEANREPRTPWLVATPRYLETLEIALVAGRNFSAADRADTAFVVMINQRFADRFLEGAEPLGRRITIQGEDREIVGVVSDVAQSRLAGLMPTEPTVYLPLAQRPVQLMRAMLRTTVDPHDVAQPVQRAIWSLDPDQPITAVQTLEEFIELQLAGPDAVGRILYLLGMLTLGLAAIGIYGAVAYAVSQQTREIGIRMALGAVPRQVLGQVTGQGLKLAAIGLLTGILPAIGVALLILRIPASIPDAGTLDMSVSPLPIGAVSLILAGVGMIASYLPARRATRIDPIVAFRKE